MNFKHNFLYLVCLTHVAVATAVKTDPLSKIVITSTNATCAKNPSSQGSFIFTYQDNVHVTFADQSTVTAESLEIIINGKIKDKKNAQEEESTITKQPSLSNFKQIIFKENVCFTSVNRKATAQTAHFYLQDQYCILEGNVKIWQAKSSPKDVPITLESQKAELHLATGQLKMLGSAQKPVSTTILLEGHPALQKREKKSKKKNTQAINDNTTKNSGSSAS